MTEPHESHHDITERFFRFSSLRSKFLRRYTTIILWQRSRSESHDQQALTASYPPWLL
jgi:hypothetical protein